MDNKDILIQFLSPNIEKHCSQKSRKLGRYVPFKENVIDLYD